MRALPILLALALGATAPAALAGELALRAEPQATSHAVTLGDLFENAGEAGARAIAPAPAPGRSSAYSAGFVQAAARAAGLEWTPPPGLTQIVVRRAGAAPERATAATKPAAEAAVRKGDLVALTYSAPGMRLTSRARAMADAAEGERVRLQTLEGSRMIEAIVTGPGAAAPAGSAP